MILRRSLALSTIATALLQVCYADIGFSSPAAGSTISGTTIDVEFEEGSGDPPLADFTTYTLQLCAGGNDAADWTVLFTFTDKGDFATDGNSYSAELTNMALGDSTEDAFFLRSIGVAPGGVVYNFSPRFTLSGMTGTFPANVIAGLTKVSGTAGPDTINAIGNTNSGAGAAATGDFSMAYTMQTGPVRYAPMAKVAPSKITKPKGGSMQYPTSGYNVWYRTGMPAPDATQTVTEAFTFAVSSIEATISPAGQPDDMQKFLNRWKD